MQNLAHSASFHSAERIAPSKPGIKHIAGRAFQRRFELADHVKVVGASLVHGLLTIDLKREIPEEMKPRRIEITADKALPKVANRQIEAEKQAA